jgi:nucleotide-binding universal stress UspA family protein
MIGINLEVSKNNLKTDGSSKNAPGDIAQSHDLFLERANQQLRKVGVKNQIEPRICHGLVVEEVLKELSNGEYELLVVGVHYQPGQDRWQGTLLDDVTGQLLNRSACSVFIT